MKTRKISEPSLLKWTKKLLDLLYYPDVDLLKLAIDSKTSNTEKNRECFQKDDDWYAIPEWLTF